MAVYHFELEKEKPGLLRVLPHRPRRRTWPKYQNQYYQTHELKFEHSILPGCLLKSIGPIFSSVWAFAHRLLSGHKSRRV